MSGTPRYQFIQGTSAASGGQAVAGTVHGDVSYQHTSYHYSVASARPDFSGHFSHSKLQAPVKAFVPRPSLRAQIRTQLSIGCNTTDTLVIWGLGGAGKTQVAPDYLQQYGKDYKATFWIEAGQRDSLERDFIELYQTLHDVPVTAGQETVSVDTAVFGVKSWFSGQGPWLLVFDGADSIRDSNAREFIDLRRYIPNVAGLHVIITSRDRDAKDMTQLEGVEVAELGERQAVELFYKYSKLRADDETIEEDIKGVVKELGHLALAITLAATYIGRTRSSIKSYLGEYTKRRRELLNQKPDDLIHQYSKSVLATWETSFQAIVDSDCPKASLVLTTLSFLNSEDIVYQLFRPQMDEHEIKECLAKLESFSLLQWRETLQSYSMHKLVHAWGHDRLSEESRHEISTNTCDLLRRAVQKWSNLPEEKLRLVPHILANFGRLEFLSTSLSETIGDPLNDLERLWSFLNGIGKYSEAHTIQDFVYTQRKRICGEEHLDTALAMNHLAITLAAQGQLKEAVKMKSKVLEIRKRVLGEGHLETIYAMNNLAETLRQQGELEEAAIIQREVLEKMKAIPSEEDVDTTPAMQNLANTLADLGQFEEALKMTREVLEERRRTLGEEHPDTLTVMGGFADMLGQQGHLEEAVEINREVLEKKKRVLGEEHPQTLSTMNNLASTLGDQEHFEEEAVTMMREVIEKRRHILGEEHPETLSAMMNLAIQLSYGEQFQEAEKIIREVVEKRRSVLGEEHPETLSAMMNLALQLSYEEQFSEAAEIIREVLEKRRRVRGEKHPDTLWAMNALAGMLAGQGHFGEAIPLMEAAAQAMRKINGNRHPDTKTFVQNLRMYKRKETWTNKAENKKRKRSG